MKIVLKLVALALMVAACDSTETISGCVRGGGFQAIAAERVVNRIDTPNRNTVRLETNTEVRYQEAQVQVYDYGRPNVRLVQEEHSSTYCFNSTRRDRVIR